MQEERRKQPQVFSVDNYGMLIRLETKVDYLTNEVKELKDSSNKRISDVELSKLDSKDFAEGFGRQLVDHEARLRLLETTVTKYLAYGAAGLFILQIILSYALKKI